MAKHPMNRSASIPSPNAATHPNYRGAACRLLGGVRARGLDPAQILREAGIATELLDNSLLKVRGQQMIRLMTAARYALGDEFLGLTAQRCKPGALTLMVELALHCDTLAAALDQMLRADHLLTDERVLTLSAHGDDVELRFTRTHPECDPEDFLIEHWLLHWQRLLSWLTGYLIPIKRIDVPFAETPSPQRLCFYINGDWNPAQPVAALVFARKYLTLPIVRTHGEWQEHLQQGLRGTPVWPEGEMRWSLRVRKLVHQALQQQQECLELEAVAAKLSTTTQTLRRHLRDEGTGFAQLRDDIRCDLAIDKLHFQRLSVNETAAQLGFSEPRSFSRAFKQWTGVSPSAYQAALVMARSATPARR
jgi:AraC-like DNA-binding protein